MLSSPPPGFSAGASVGVGIGVGSAEVSVGVGAGASVGTGVAVAAGVGVGVPVTDEGVDSVCDKSELDSDDSTVGSGVGVGVAILGIELLTVPSLILIYCCIDTVDLAGSPEDRNLWLPGALESSASVIM